MRKPVFPNTNLNRLGKTSGYPQLHNFTFLHCTISISDQFRPVRKLYIILGNCLCCRDLDSFAPNDKHSLEQFWNLAFTISKVEPLRMARPGWLARQAKLKLYGFWHRTAKTFHWPRNVKSTVRKARSSQTQHKTGLHSDN